MPTVFYSMHPLIPMGHRGWGSRSSIRSMLVLIALVITTQPVLANPVASPFTIMFLLIPVNFPINGFVLLMMYLLFIHFKGSPSPHGTWNFIELFLEVVLIITALGALIDMFALFSFERMYISAAIIGALTLWVAYSALQMSMVWSVLTGIVFFWVNLISWVMLMVLAFSFTFLLIILGILAFLFIVLLGRTAHVFHRVDGPVVWDERLYDEDGGRLPQGLISGSFIRTTEDNLSAMRVYTLATIGIVSFIGVI